MFVRKTSFAVPIICTSVEYAQKASITFLHHHKLAGTREPFGLKNLAWMCLHKSVNGLICVDSNIALKHLSLRRCIGILCQLNAGLSPNNDKSSLIFFLVAGWGWTNVIGKNEVLVVLDSPGSGEIQSITGSLICYNFFFSSIAIKWKCKSAVFSSLCLKSPESLKWEIEAWLSQLNISFCWSR